MCVCVCLLVWTRHVLWGMQGHVAVVLREGFASPRVVACAWARAGGAGRWRRRRLRRPTRRRYRRGREKRKSTRGCERRERAAGGGGGEAAREREQASKRLAGTRAVLDDKVMRCASGPRARACGLANSKRGGHVKLVFT